MGGLEAGEGEIMGWGGETLEMKIGYGGVQESKGWGKGIEGYGER